MIYCFTSDGSTGASTLSFVGSGHRWCWRAVDYLLPIFRKANTYAHLLEGGITGNPDRLSNKELHERAWALVQPQFVVRQKQAIAQYQQLAGTGRAASDLEQVVPAAYRGDVETLLIAAECQRWGRFDPASARLEQHERREPGDEDLLNVAAVHTLRHGGSVYALKSEQVPDGTPLAAIFSLPLAKRGKRP